MHFTVLKNSTEIIGADTLNNQNDKKIPIITIVLIMFSLNSYAWDFSIKGDAQRSSSDNVNLSSTGQVSDSYTTLSAYLQAKNENYKFKLKGKTEQYNSQTGNDNYTTDLSAQYKHSKNDDYTIGVFKQVYNGTPTVINDTSSDNNGGRLSANFSKDYDKNSSGYFSLNATYKKYTKIANRIDTILGSALGFEHYFTSIFMVNPELNIQNNSSKDSYYKNFSYGPSLLFDLTPNDSWEFVVSGAYSYTNYSGRFVTTTTLRGKTTSVKEYQELLSTDASVIYTFPKYLSVQFKYSIANNSSNNATSAYKANVSSFNLGLKF